MLLITSYVILQSLEPTKLKVRSPVMYMLQVVIITATTRIFPHASVAHFYGGKQTKQNKNLSNMYQLPTTLCYPFPKGFGTDVCEQIAKVVSLGTKCQKMYPVYNFPISLTTPTLEGCMCQNKTYT